VRSWRDFFGILEDHECGMNHNQERGEENKIRGAKSAEMATPTPIDANMQRVLHEVCEDSKQQGKLHCVAQHHRSLRDSYAGESADKQRPTSATNNEGKANKPSKPGVPQACVGTIWRLGSTTSFLQLRLRIPRISGKALLGRTDILIRLVVQERCLLVRKFWTVPWTVLGALHGVQSISPSPQSSDSEGGFVASMEKTEFYYLEPP